MRTSATFLKPTGREEKPTAASWDRGQRPKAGAPGMPSIRRGKHQEVLEKERGKITGQKENTLSREANIFFKHAIERNRESARVGASDAWQGESVPEIGNRRYSQTSVRR